MCVTAKKLGARIATVLALLLVAGGANAAAHGSMFGPQRAKQPKTMLLIHAGQLLAVPGEAPLTAQTVIVKGAKIVEIRPGFMQLEDMETQGIEVDKGMTVEVIDLSNRFVMPGLMDSHVHLSRATGSYQSGFAAINSYPPVAEATVNALRNARLSIAAGFTAVRDLGSDPDSVFAVREAINAGHFAGPTIIASGASIGVTAGHGDDAANSDPDERARAGVCDGPDECRTLTRHLEKTGSDLIKIKITGGFSSNTGLRQHMAQDEMQAIVEAAHLRGIRVTAHAYEAGAIGEAVAAGVDSIEHGYLLDKPTLKLMERNGVYLVPTLTVAQPPSMVKRFLRGREPSSVILRNENRAFEQAYELGVKIAFGTDCGIYPHGRNVDEMLEMVRLGMAPADVLRSATVVAAELFGRDDLSGTLEPGGAADIIAVAGNPLDSIAVMQTVPFVLKAGRVFKRDGVMQLPLDYTLPQKY